MADYSITGDTRLDTSGFQKGISSMTVAAGNLLSGLVQTATGKLAGLATASVAVGRQFDASMSQVAATMGTGVDEIQNLTAVAKEMGSTTKFTATQAADALNYLALAGYDADKAAEVLPSVLNLAAAGGMDLAYASDLVTDAMASLNIEASKQNVDEFGNKLAMAASKANADVSQLGEAILTVGGTAANLKGGTTELTTALGLLANVGIKGAEGGTHLRNIILSLQSPTDDAAKMLDALGIAVYDAQGNMRGLDEILSDLAATMDGMTQGQKDSVLNQLFNKTDIAAVTGLLAAQGEQWDSLAAQIDSADGAMERMAQTQIENLDGAITIMESSFEGLQLAVYERLEPALTEGVQYATDCLGQLSTALSKGGPEAMLAAAGDILAALADGIAQRLPDLAASAVQIVATLSQKLTAALPAILSTGGQVLEALVQGIARNLPVLLSSATGIVINLVKYLDQNADQIVDGGIRLVESLITGIANNLPALITAAGQLIASFAGALLRRAPDILDCALSLVGTLADGFVLGLETIAEAALAIVAKIIGVWDGAYSEWGHIGENIIAGIRNGLLGAVDGLVSAVSGMVGSVISTAKNLLGIHSPSRVFSEIGMQTCAGLAKGLTDSSTKVKDAAKTVVASVTDTSTEVLDGVTRTVETVTETMLNGATRQKQVITETENQIVDGALKTVETVRTLAADGTETVTQTIKDSAAAGLDELWQEIKDRDKTGLLGSINALSAAVKQGDWKSIGKWAASALYAGLSADQKQQIEHFALGMVDQLSAALQGAQTTLAQAAWNLGGRIVQGITGGFDEILSRSQTLADGILSAFAALTGPLSAAAKAAGAGLETGLLGAVPSICAGMGGLIATLGGAVSAALDAIAAALSATVFGIPAGIVVAGAAVALGAAIAAIVAGLGGSKGSGKTASGSGSSGKSSTVIASATDISTVTGADDAKTTTKTVTETLRDEAGKLTERVTKTVTETGTRMVDGQQRAYTKVTTFVDGVQTKVETTLEDLAKKAETKTAPAPKQDAAPAPKQDSAPAPDPADEKLTAAVTDNTAALTAANARLADMVRKAGSLVLSDNMRLSRSVAASGTAHLATDAARFAPRQGDTNITQNIYSKAQTAADLARETRWEADRAKARKC